MAVDSLIFFLQNHWLMNAKARKLSNQLRNVGPKLAQRLINAGIDSPSKLAAMGAKAAFLKMYQKGDAYGDFNAAYLYALEGAIRGCDWLDIPEDVKANHMRLAHQLQADKSSS